MTHQLLATDYVEAARSLGPRIRACADETEANRRLPLPLVREIAAAGLFRVLLPCSLGGAELDPVTYMTVMEELSAADGAAGWCVLVGSNAAWHIASRLRPEVSAELFGPDPDVVAAGSALPRGRAEPVEGGYLVSGRWTMGSGIEHSAWVMAGCREPGDPPRPLLAVFPTADVTVLDTWNSTGLRGTGSHDFAVEGVFVPAERTFDPAGPPAHDGPLFRYNYFPQIAHAGHALGIGRAALDAFVDLAGGSKPARSPVRGLLRERSRVQADVARADALVGSARAWMETTTRDLWDTVCRREEPTPAQRARFRLAIAHSMSSAREAVDLLYHAAGAMAVYATGPLDRCFRDIHTAGAHAWVQQETYPLAGRLLLGLDVGAAPI